MTENIFAEALAQDEVVAAEIVPAEDDFETLRANYYRALRERAIKMQNDVNFDLDEADIRFSTSLDLRRVRNSLVVVIGGGGLGNWQWRILASMGFRRIAVFDDDEVGIENVGSQCHSIFELGNPKVEAINRAAMEYRGMSVIGVKNRVQKLSDIVDALGEVPEIVIGCTDSADFRKGFAFSLLDYDSPESVPCLYLDYRMSLGDWAAYIYPVRFLYSHGMLLNDFHDWYREQALFDSSEALVEPCTERAISYTGANMASFTGSILHWYFTEGRQKLGDEVYLGKFARDETYAPSRFTSFSARDFEFITDTRAVAAQRHQAIKEYNKRAHLENLLCQASGITFSPGELNFIGWADKYTDFAGKILFDTNNNWHFAVCGFGMAYWLYEEEVTPLEECDFTDKVLAEIMLGDNERPNHDIVMVRVLVKMAQLMRYPEGSVFRAESAQLYILNKTAYLRTSATGAKMVFNDSKDNYFINWIEDYSNLAQYSFTYLPEVPDEALELFGDAVKASVIEKLSPSEALAALSVGDVVRYNSQRYIILDMTHQVVLGAVDGEIVKVSRKLAPNMKKDGHIYQLSTIPSLADYMGYCGPSEHLVPLSRSGERAAAEDDDYDDDCMEYSSEY